MVLVFIAIKSNLNFKHKHIKVKCKAEILSVQISLGNNGKSICLCTFYWGGTLVAEHHKVVETYLTSVAKTMKLSTIWMEYAGVMPLRYTHCHWNWIKKMFATAVVMFYIFTLKYIHLIILSERSMIREMFLNLLL